MKKIFLLILIYISPLIAFSQRSMSRHAELLLNALLVNKPDAKPDGVIFDLQPLKKINSKYRPFGGESVKYSKFDGDTLKVIEIRKFKQFDFAPAENHLILKSLKHGDLYEYNFNLGILEFKVVDGSIAMNESSFCSDVTESVDKFTDVKIVESPPNIVEFSKITKDGHTGFFMTCATHTNAAEGLNKNGVIILFTDGSKKDFPDVPIQVNASSSSLGGFDYRANVPLSDDDLKLFTQKKIAAFRLYIVDRDVPQIDAPMFQAYLMCILNNH